MRGHAALAVAVLAVFGVSSLVARPLQQPAQDTPVFRGSVQLIQVDVRVFDRNGTTVRGLTKDDFTLLEDGTPQTVVTASFVDLERESPIARMIPGVIPSDVATNAGVGRMWVILLGGSSGPGGRVSRARQAARLFVQESLGPNDQVAIINVQGTMKSAQAFTRNRELLLDAIDRLDEAPSNPLPNATRIAYNVLEEVCNRLGRMAGRKAVLYFDPPTFFSVEGPPPVGPDGRGTVTAANNDVSNYLDQRDALAAATRNNVAIYVVSTTGIAGTSPDQPVIEAEPGRNLKQIAGQRLLADETGGDAIVNTNNYLAGYERFVRDSNQYYLLGYSPRVEHRDGDFHQVTVRVNRPGLTVRARRGYYAPREGRPARQTESTKIASKVSLSPAALEALRMPLSVNGLTIDLFAAPFRAATGRNASVLVGAQVHGPDLALSRGETIEVGFVGLNTEGKTSPGAFHIAKLELLEASRQVVEGVGLPFVDRLSLAPGRHQVKFVANQPNGKTGMVVVDVDVPKFDDEPLAMSGLVLATVPPAPQAVMRRDATLQRFLFNANPTALRRFSPREVLTTYLEVYTNSKTRVNETVASIARVGQNQPRQYAVPPLVTAPGRTMYRRQFPLREFQPGDYVLTFEARSDKQTVRRAVPYTIAER